MRWSAIEILSNGTALIEKSDVWSFGIFLWEMFHLGSALPYGIIGNVEALVNFLKNGNRLDMPQLCPEFLYDLMMKCWNENPCSR